MECEKIVVKELFREETDPVNIYIYATAEEVVDILKSEGFVQTWVQNPAIFLSRQADVALIKPFIWALKEFFRAHVRLWLIEKGGTVVGNAHIDVATVAADVSVVKHEAFHDAGRAIIADAFLKRGYKVVYERCEGNFKNFDGFVAKIYKPERQL